MKQYFYLKESENFANKYTIDMNHEFFLFPTGMRGSYRVVLARVMNLSYANSLRYLRDKLGAELIGKNSRYVIPYVEKTAEVKEFVKLMNLRMEYIMSVHDDPYEYTKLEDGTIQRVPMFSNEVNG